MKNIENGSGKLYLVAGSTSMQLRNLLIEIRTAKSDAEKMALLSRVEATMAGCLDQLRAAMKARTYRPRPDPRTETPWSMRKPL